MITNTLFLILSSNLMTRPISAVMMSHYKCRGGIYPRSKVQRFPVPDDKVSWASDYQGYDPPSYTSPGIHGKPWADPEIDDPNFQPKWNRLDGKVNRTSYIIMYPILEKYPLNPIGRTGIIGRGVLGRWGPNHAADPVVTRWKKINGEKEVHQTSSKPILQFVAIKRGDTGEWALPGGMVDPGEKVAAAAVREFQEEATNSFTMSDDEKQEWKNKFQEFFSKGDAVFHGYVDDPRNTDNAWMETIAFNFHDDDGTTVGTLKLHAGDDAVGVRWVDVERNVKLYASHANIVEAVSKKLGAHW